jgi:hypothetical protein
MSGEGDDGFREHWARTRALLAELERAAASALGEAETAQAREFLDHNELGLALEALVSAAVDAGLDPPPPSFAEGVEEAAARMGLSDSEDIAAWRRRRDGRAG